MTTNPNQPHDPVGEEMPLLSHLVEMRDRLLRAVLAILLIFVGIFYFANDLYHLVALPLMDNLQQGQNGAAGGMIATNPAGTFFTPMKLSLVLSIFAAMPFILYQMWAFVAPGLYTHERKLIVPLLISSTLLFYAGMAFAYFVVFPLMFGFFAAVAPEGVTYMPDISEYLDFILKIFFAFGVAFEVPIATILLVWIGATTPESLGQKRPYIIVGAFVVGMLLTPPDIISQTLLALPMWLLFEAGLFASRYFLRLKREHQKDQDEADNLDTDEEMDAALDRYEAEEHNITTKGEKGEQGQ